MVMRTKNKNITQIFIVCLTLGLLIYRPPLSTADTEIPDVIINEVAWAGSSVSSSDEWIELKNTTDQDIDISGWQVTKKTDTVNAMITITTGNIPANGYFLISNYNENHASSVLNIKPDLESLSVSLSNEDLVISLYKGDWHNLDNLVDIAGDGTNPFCPGDSSTKISMERNAEYGDGDLSDSWHEASDTINLDEGVADKGTPKAENSVPPPPALEAPKIISVSPDQAEAETIWEVEEILGENFVVDGVTQVKLVKGTLTIWATDVNVVSDTTIATAKFDLHSAEAGDWDIVIINPDGQIATLPNAVEIIEPEEEPEVPVYSSAIVLNELYPHPSTGAEEYIELYNSGNSTVNLKGWKLDDQSPGGSSVHTISSDTLISAHQYLIFPKSQTHISLNDTGDYVRLLQPNDNLLDSTSNYGTAITGYAYAKINGNWQWTKRVTPNSANIYESIVDEEEENDDNNDTDQELQNSDITIELGSATTTEASAKLTWKINWPGALGEISIYQSDKKGDLGEKIGQVTPNKTEYLVNQLTAKTKYYFTLIGSYNGQDIKSNQIEITATSPSSPPAGGGSEGLPKQIIFTEILPNPNAGDSEFIEIYNSTDQDIDISGWKLVDASGKTYVLTALDLERLIIAEINSGVILKSNKYLLLDYSTTNIRLNNSGGEEIQLLDAEDNLIDEITYESSAKQGFAYVLAPNEEWFWSNEVTPGEANDISFAGIIGDDGELLVDSGNTQNKSIPLLISLLLSVIILTYVKRNYFNHARHQ